MSLQASTSAINLLLVDDHEMFRQGLARVLDKETDFNVVGQFGSCAEALSQLVQSGASVVLLDIDLGNERALDFVMKARSSGFEGHILIVTAGASEQEAIQLVQAGVAGILHKQHSTEVLCNTIRKVASGGIYLENDYLPSLYRSVDRTKAKNQVRLTERDKVVLRFIFQGMTNKEIGRRLEISESGVKSSLQQLFDKLGVRTRAQLVKVALEQYRDQL